MRKASLVNFRLHFFLSWQSAQLEYRNPERGCGNIAQETASSSAAIKYNICFFVNTDRGMLTVCCLSPCIISYQPGFAEGGSFVVLD